MTEQQTYDGPTEIVQTRNLGTPTAFCSVRDIHAYYAESYIVQGVSFNIHEGESSHCSDEMGRKRQRSEP